MKKLLFCSSLFIAAQTLNAQDTMLLWENSIGGTSDDTGYFIERTSDGGSIVSGNSKSANGDMASNFGDNDVLLTKLDASGATVWIKNLGGTLSDEGYSVHQTVDGGYLVTGYTRSSDGHIASSQGLKDIWVVKLSGLGTIQWENTYGGTADERAFYSTQTSDGGYIMAGYTESNDGDVTLNQGSGDVWIVKIDSAGTLLWQKSYGGTGGDYGYFISETSDGGYIVTANTDSNNGDVSGYHGGFSDVWVLKINSIGILQWQKCLGGTSDEYTTAVYQTAEGGYIVCAYTASSDGDITSTHGDFENWLVKLSGTGSIQWQKCYGGSFADGNYSFKKTLDGKYIIAGYAYSGDGDVVGQHGGGEADYWIVKTDTAGTLEWQTCLGGTGNDQAFSISQLSDSTYVIAGLSASTNGDISIPEGLDDCWVVHIGPAPVFTDAGTISSAPSQKEINVYVYPNPNNGSFYLKNLQKNNQIELFNVRGECLLRQTAASASQKIDFSDMAKGIYFYRVSSDTDVKTGKVIVH